MPRTSNDRAGACPGREIGQTQHAGERRACGAGGTPTARTGGMYPADDTALRIQLLIDQLRDTRDRVATEVARLRTLRVTFDRLQRDFRQRPRRLS